MRPYTKRRPFSRRSSGKERSAPFSGDPARLPLESIDRLSVFESLRVYGGKIFRLDEHLSRLKESCIVIGRPLPHVDKEIEKWLYASLKARPYKGAVLRLSIHWLSDDEGELLLFIKEFSGHPKEWYEKGVTLRTAAGRRSSPRAQDTQVKTSQYVGGVLAYLDGAGTEQGSVPTPHEYLFFGPEGTLAEGAVSNIFIIKRKCLLTPSAASGILKGVTRDLVLGLARRRRLPVLETHLTRHDLYTADECFITNTSSEVLPVAAVDGRRIGDGRPGPVTRALGRDFKKIL